MIIVIDDLLSRVECDTLIQIYANNIHRTHDFNECRPLNLDNIEFDQDYVIDIARRVEQTACKYFGTNVIDWAELFMRPPNTWHPYHTDDASEKTSITSVTYLNDGVNGGFTQFIDGTQVKPIAGRTIIFDGKKYVHGVSPVVEGVRYTMPIWYQSESK